MSRDRGVAGDVFQNPERERRAGVTADPSLTLRVLIDPTRLRTGDPREYQGRRVFQDRHDAVAGPSGGQGHHPGRERQHPGAVRASKPFRRPAAGATRWSWSPRSCAPAFQAGGEKPGRVAQARRLLRFGGGPSVLWASNFDQWTTLAVRARDFQDQGPRGEPVQAGHGQRLPSGIAGSQSATHRVVMPDSACQRRNRRSQSQTSRAATTRGTCRATRRRPGAGGAAGEGQPQGLRNRG